MNNAYTLKINKNGECHLFEGYFTDDDKCTSNKKSVCNKMNKEDSINNIFTCYDENDAREKCAEIGRNVCGICISTLYKSID